MTFFQSFGWIVFKRAHLNVDNRPSSMHSREQETGLRCAFYGPDHIVATYYGALVYDNLYIGASRCSTLYDKCGMAIIDKGILN